jgi:hypothetical protein
MSDAQTVLLFSYGTLQSRNVQLANFGRELTGHHDALLGYVQRMIGPLHRALADLSGHSHLENIEPSVDPQDWVAGIVYEVTESELLVADSYEIGGDYGRIFVTLRSGAQAWVYLRPSGKS